jgi:Permuted papain-like amidase enzyme, YaeF/YiiX, C92 family
MGVRSWVGLMAVVATLQGCATQFSTGYGADEDSPLLQFQSNYIAPAAVVERELVQAGDILLTTDPTLTSASIRLMTLAPVSHAAVYVGDGKVAEALGSGVRVRQLDELLAEASAAYVLRYPDLTDEQAALIRQYAEEKAGTGFNFLGVTLHIPFAIGRRVCELPLVPSTLRDGCIRSIGVLHHLAARERRLFCSQLVLQAYRHAGVQVTGADARLISPADILHMREGDVSSVKIARQLRYVGSLKNRRPMATLAFQH